MRSVHPLIVLFCIALVLVAGCASSSTGTAAPATSPQVSAGGITGTWTATFGGRLCIMTISPDGTVQQHMGGTSDIRNAKWTSEGSGKYSLSTDMVVGRQSPLIYDDKSGTITDNVGIVWSRSSNDYTTIVPTVPTKDPRSARVKFGKGDGYLIADVTNIGSSSESYILVIDFYDGAVKVDTRTPSTPQIAPGETGRVKIYVPSDANKYNLDGVAVSIGGKIYKVYYDVEYV